ncbi:hypothetical protein [uncultured Winogradskyella sp.]|uniref:hypothetical protein n=1 Tax=uncultured Winogradskyella sp. TaxID=395353 RepID=UPI0026133A4B|nr:hypothetical protein [uncultured Winogradskyella sp.]
MKAKFFRLGLLTLMLVAFYGCCEKCEKDKKDYEIKIENCEEKLEAIEGYLDLPFGFAQYIPNSFDFCNTEESITPKNDYNTVTGIANFSIPIPKGSNLKFIKKDNDTLYYECNGHGKIEYNDKDLIIENKTVANLAREEKYRIWIEVTFKNFKEDTCNELIIFQEKKKKSEVQGLPLN